MISHEDSRNVGYGHASGHPQPSCLTNVKAALDLQKLGYPQQEGIKIVINQHSRNSRSLPKEAESINQRFSGSSRTTIHHVCDQPEKPFHSGSSAEVVRTSN
jgi:hypothetical protein